MDRDYAKKRPQPATKSRRLWTIAIIILLLVLSIPTLFYAHYMHMPHFQMTNIKVAPLIKKQPPPDKHNARVVQKEFDFYSMLPAISVDIKKGDVTTLQVPTDQPYYLLQVATSTDKTAADDLVTKLGVMGLNAFTKIAATTNKTTQYRIVVGPYLSKENADTDFAYLKTNHVNSIELKINNYPK